jgi:hypothetical protein
MSRYQAEGQNSKPRWVSKMDKTRMNRYQMAKQLYGLVTRTQTSLLANALSTE